MKSIRKLVCLALCLVMLASVLPAGALALDNADAGSGSTGTLNKANYYCTAPVVGEMPSLTMTSDVDDLVYFNHAQWLGDFAEDGSFLAGEKYSFYFRAHIRDGVDLVFPKEVTEETCHAVNGTPLEYYFTSNGGKTLLVTFSFQQLEEDPNEVDSWHYTREEADACWWDSMPKLFVADSVDDTMTELTNST